MARGDGAGRPSKGERFRMAIALPYPFVDHIRDEAARRGLTLNDFVGEALAHELGIDYPEYHPKRQQPELDLTG